jgi:hypothetical protein
VDDYRKGLSLTVNPRYGVLGADGQLGDPTGGAVSLLDSPAPASGAAPAGTGAGTPTGTAGG